MLQLQKDFETFKHDLKETTSRQEYQKLYEACVQECAKSQKYYRLFTQSEVQVATHKNENNQLKDEVNQLQASIRGLKEQQSRESDSVLKTVIDQQRTIDQLRYEISSLKASNHSLSMEVKDKDSLIHSLMDQIKAKDNQIAEVNQILSEL